MNDTPYAVPMRKLRTAPKSDDANAIAKADMIGAQAGFNMLDPVASEVVTPAPQTPAKAEKKPTRRVSIDLDEDVYKIFVQHGVDLRETRQSMAVRFIIDGLKREGREV